MDLDGENEIYDYVHLNGLRIITHISLFFIISCLSCIEPMRFLGPYERSKIVAYQTLISILKGEGL